MPSIHSTRRALDSSEHSSAETPYNPPWYNDFIVQLGYVNAIAVSGSTIYIAGYRNDGTKDIPVAWMGTTLGTISTWSDLPIPAGSNPGRANSIAAE
jgi:hypothetical protein